MFVYHAKSSIVADMCIKLSTSVDVFAERNFCDAFCDVCRQRGRGL